MGGFRPLWPCAGNWMGLKPKADILDLHHGFLHPLACCMLFVDFWILVHHLYQLGVFSVPLVQQTTMDMFLVALETLSAGCLVSMVFAKDAINFLHHGYMIHCIMAVTFAFESSDNGALRSVLGVAMLNVGVQIMVFKQVSTFIVLMLFMGWTPGHMLLCAQSLEVAYIPLTRRTCQRSFGYFISGVLCTLYFQTKMKLQNDGRYLQQFADAELGKAHVLSKGCTPILRSPKVEYLATFIFIRWIHGTIPEFPGHAAWCVLGFLGHIPQKQNLTPMPAKAKTVPKKQLELLINNW